MSDSTSANENWQYEPNAEIPPGEQLPPGVRRIALGIEYNGAPYCGWQRQKHSPSVQQALEEALSSVANESVKLVCAGRTDTGVHGSEQVVHFDTQATRSERNWMMGVNSSIDRSIALLWSKEVSPEFHARFSATSRTYRYIISNTPHRPSILSDGLTWVRDDLDESAMDRALELIKGERDFTSFRGAGCQSHSPFRCISHTSVIRHGSMVIVEITANAFLLHMVRNIVGLLIEIGRHKAPEDEMLRVLELKDRTKAGVTAPPYGLYLVKVGYPSHFDLPNRPIGPGFLSL